MNRLNCSNTAGCDRPRVLTDLRRVAPDEAAVLGINKTLAFTLTQLSNITLSHSLTPLYTFWNPHRFPSPSLAPLTPLKNRGETTLTLTHATSALVHSPQLVDQASLYVYWDAIFPWVWVRLDDFLYTRKGLW
ncbi:hypothetical protein E2C01_068075 [Portunus trituberculatus]|uniref:Uncharacterized protein n=1 Tax=Portunus trituberculatus TaxID=210409 RepID=A0A5B7HYH8_PORTR|nr:hypothetical protein [Portunus trituberculatus]